MDMTPEQRAILDYLNKGPEYENYIFEKLEKLEYFDVLCEAGFFSAEKNPGPQETEKDWFSIPQWPALKYLEKVSITQNSAYAPKLLNILHDVTCPSGDPAKRADNYRTWWYFTKILSNLPTDVVQMRDVGLIVHWLDSKFEAMLVGHAIGERLLPKFLATDKPEDWVKAAKIVEIVTRIKWTERKHGDSEIRREPKTAIDDHWLRELFEENAVALGEKCGRQVGLALKSRLEELADDENSHDRYSYIWRPAIEDHPQNHQAPSTTDTLVAALRDVCSAYLKNQNDVALVREFLKSKSHFVVRTGFHVINAYFDRFSDPFWETFKGDTQKFLLDLNYRHELYKLFEARFSKFSDPLKNDLVDAIETIKGDWRDDVDKEKMNAYVRLRWFTAIKGQGHPQADERYEHYKKMSETEEDIEHPDLSSYTTTSSGHERPIAPNDLMSKGTVAQIVSFLNEYAPKDKYGYSAEEGTGEVLKDAIKSNAAFFEKDLLEFLKLKSRKYHYYVTDALGDVRKEQKDFNWKQVLDYLKKLIEDDAFWKWADEIRGKSGDYPNGDWIVSAIARLVERGVISDERALSEELMDTVRVILLRLLDKQPSSVGDERDDFLTAAINSSKGQIIEAYINYALRKFRLCEQQKESKDKIWPEIQAVLDSELDRTKNGNFEFSALAGRYIPNLMYMNPEWVATKFNEIFPKERDKNWTAAMHGYSYVGRVYAGIYELLKKNDHLDKSLETDVVTMHGQNKVLEHIGVAYLRGVESLDDPASLISKIVTKWKQEQISRIIHFFWALRDESSDDEDMRPRILAFWRVCFEKCKGHESENEKILSDLNLLAVFLKGIDAEQKSWLLQSVPYSEVHFHIDFFTEYLNQLADANPLDVADIFLALLEHAPPPTYEEETIQSIVEKIYKAGGKDAADRICDKYVRAGSEFLREIYERYHQS